MTEMQVDGEINSDTNYRGRWRYLQNILSRSGPFVHPDFEASSDILPFITETCRILVIGAGGLGCEILKNLALSGFHNIEVIDMDIIDVSNLNRQFLFRHTDVGKAKATAAANFVNKRVPGCKIVPHVCKIQEFDSSFYRKFHIIVCGLDSIIARRWMNGMLISMLQYNDDGSLDQSSLIPLVDGGTEGFKGNARVILPGINACIECTLDLYPPQINYPMCTIAHTPRLPEHCIEYAKTLLWPQENPFGKGMPIDGDDAAHIEWLYKQALERAEEYGITGVNYRLTQGVVKHIIPAVASTNAVISAACVTEVFKIASSCCVPLNNYLVFNDVDGVYTYTFEAEKDENCLSCSQKPRKIHFKETNKLNDIYEYLQNDSNLQMKSPSLTTTVDGKNKTLYMKTIPVIEKATKINLSKTLKELGLLNEQELYVSDITTPKTLVLILQLSSE